MSDGEDHDQSAFDIAKKMRENGIVIHTIGVGTVDGGEIIDPETKQVKIDETGNPIVSKLNEKELQQLAETGNGSYQMLTDEDAAANTIMRNINGMEKKSIEDLSQQRYQSLYQWFLLAALLLLIAEMLIPERKLNQQ